MSTRSYQKIITFYFALHRISRHAKKSNRCDIIYNVIEMNNICLPISGQYYTYSNSSSRYRLTIIFVFFYSSIQNEDVDTSDSAPSNNNSSRSTSTPQSRPDSADDNSATSPANVTRPEAGLPAGWSMQIAPNGRMFFIDHNERKTSWVDPRTGRASPMPSQTRPPEDDLGSLPEGWEERVHSDGRIFFIDHSVFCLKFVLPFLIFNVLFLILFHFVFSF